MATKRTAVLKVKIEAIYPIDLKDSKSVAAASQAFEMLKDYAADIGFSLTADSSTFGNADIEIKPATKDAE